MKDVSLPVCHKSSVLLCDRLADRASSVSLGTHRLLLWSRIFFFEKLLSFSEAGRQREREGGRVGEREGGRSCWFGVLKQTCLSLIRLLVSVKVYGLCRAESPQSTIMTRRITKKKKKKVPLDGSSQRRFTAFEELAKTFCIMTSCKASGQCWRWEHGGRASKICT